MDGDDLAQSLAEAQGAGRERRRLLPRLMEIAELIEPLEARERALLDHLRVEPRDAPMIDRQLSALRQELEPLRAELARGRARLERVAAAAAALPQLVERLDRVVRERGSVYARQLEELAERDGDALAASHEVEEAIRHGHDALRLAETRTAGQEVTVPFAIRAFQQECADVISDLSLSWAGLTPLRAIAELLETDLDASWSEPLAIDLLERAVAELSRRRTEIATVRARLASERATMALMPEPGRF